LFKRVRTVAVAAAILVATSLVVGWIAPASADTSADAAKTAAQPLRGISVAGGEFEGTTIPTFDTKRSFQFLASRGYTVVRLPFLWESVQPTLSEPLDPAAMARIEGAVADATSAGLAVILDVHNYARYDGVAYGAANSFTQADFVDLWTRLSTEFRNDPGVLGYGLMNEPHDLPEVAGVSGNVRWQQAQQAALTAIRDNGDVTCVLVSGYTYSSMAGWFNPTGGQPTPYITDPANNFRWEAHDYWDMDSSGRYIDSYADDNDAVPDAFATDSADKETNRVMFQLDQWIQWLKDNNQKGYIGEFGWPSAENGKTPTDAATWDALAKTYLADVNDTAGDLLWTTAWATGTQWRADYELQYYSSTDGSLTTPLSNAATLEANALELNPNPPNLDPIVPPSDPGPAPASPAPASPAPATATVVATGATTTGATTTGAATTIVTTKASSIHVVVAGHSRHPKLTVTVKSKARVTGTVSVLLGKRVLAKAAKLKSGKVVIKLKPTVSVGTHTLVVKYAGTKTVKASSTRVKVRVVR
jgi:endoglucanase